VALQLQARGWDDVYPLKGGYAAWLSARLPTETK
jgi:3-mercaptopyruvate sulfurtransferase SseA